MEHLPLVLSALALLLAVLALARSSRRSGAAEELDDRVRRRIDAAREELAADLDLHKKMLARLARGSKLTPAMIEEGRLWDDVDAKLAHERLSSGAWRALDVRTPREVASGMLAGAVCIPVDELEARADELRSDARPLLVYCASGARSAAACDFLSRAGIDELHNLEAGLGGWTHGTVRPSTA
jgi:rhodanese-related sulfurtransferase